MISIVLSLLANMSRLSLQYKETAFTLLTQLEMAGNILTTTEHLIAAAIGVCRGGEGWSQMSRNSQIPLGPAKAKI